MADESPQGGGESADGIGGSAGDATKLFLSLTILIGGIKVWLCVIVIIIFIGLTGAVNDAGSGAGGGEGSGDYVATDTGSAARLPPGVEVNSYGLAHIPSRGAGFVVANQGAGMGYLTKCNMASLLAFAAEWGKLHPKYTLGINDCGRGDGRGDFSRHPSSGHANGRHADIRPISTEGGGGATNWRAGNYDYDLTRELIIRLNQWPGVKVTLFNDKRIPGAVHADGHDDHIHVGFNAGNRCE